MRVSDVSDFETDLDKKSDCKAEKQKSILVLKNQSYDLSTGTSEKQLIPELWIVLYI